MVGITGSSRVVSADASTWATNVKAGKVNSFSDVMAKSLADNSSVGDDSFKMNVGTPKESVKTKETQPVKNDAVDETNNIDDSAANDQNEVVTKSEEAAKDILDKIKEELNVSDEELAEAMEILGLSLTDLLQPGNILKLFMEVTGTQDAMVLVTDAQLSESLKNILDYAGVRINELTDQLNMTAGELNDMIDSMELSGQQSESVVTEDVAVDVAPETVEDVIASKITVTNSNESGNNSGMGSDTTKEQAADMRSNGDGISQNGGIGEMVSQISASFEAALASDVSGIDQADVVRQVIDSIKLNNSQAMQSIEVALNPENLGKVNVLVSVREGVLTAQIITENEQVKRAIENQISTLKETFESQGVKVEAVEVTVQSHAFENNSAFTNEQEEGQATSKTGKKLNLEGLNMDEEEEETVTETVSVHENSSVEYLA